MTCMQLNCHEPHIYDDCITQTLKLHTLCILERKHLIIALYFINTTYPLRK